MNKSLSAAILTVSLACGLGGCAAAVVGGAGAAALSATDRRTTGAQTDDQVMEVRIRESALSYLNTQTQPAGFSPKLSVVSYNHQILLLGLVANDADKATVERVARAQSAAQKVYNYIDVATQGRGLGAVTNDTWVTSKVRTNLLNAPGLSPNHVKVVTYNGVTYVMGILTLAEQQVAAQTVSTTVGVKKVITLFQTFEAPTTVSTGGN